LIVRQAAAARAKNAFVFTQATETHLEAHAPSWRQRRASLDHGDPARGNRPMRN
jgi:hypothetical protein